jgi:hypothetical protein
MQTDSIETDLLRQAGTVRNSWRKSWTRKGEENE